VFHGGAVGYLGYETVRHFERLPVAVGPTPGLPESAFLAEDDLVVFDHATRRKLPLTLHRPAAEPYDAALARITLMKLRPRCTASRFSGRPLVSTRDSADELAGWWPNTTRATLHKARCDHRRARGGGRHVNPNARTIMGLRHRDHPTFGVRFHSESMLSPEGKQLVADFLARADV
jgi:anthranilate synthase component 1